MTRTTRRDLLTALAACLPALALRRIFAWAVTPLPLVEAGASSPSEVTGTRGDLPWFTDIGKRSTFPYRTNNGFAGRKYFPLPMCGGVAAIDYDSDGKMD